MSKLKQHAESIALAVLRRRGIPEDRLHKQMRKTGRGFLLASIVFIIPLVTFDHIDVWIKVALQFVYLVMVCLGVLLAFDETKTQRS